MAKKIAQLVEDFKDKVSDLVDAPVRNPKKKCPELSCPFYLKEESPYKGPRDAEIVVVGDSPSQTEILRGAPFLGTSGLILNALLESIEYPRSQVYVANAIRCMLNKDKDSTKDQNEALRTCRGKLAKTLSIIKPKLIISLGGVALKQLLKKSKITENRGRFFYSEEFGCQVFVTVHPNFVLRGASQEFWKKPRAERTMLENLLFEDFKQVRQFMETGEVPGLVTSEYREGTADDLQQLAKCKIVSFDFETTGLNLFDPELRVLCVSLCGEAGKPTVYFYDQKKGFPKGVKEILTNPKIAKTVANRPFDERVCRQKLGFEVKGQIHDVFTMAHLIDENYRRYNLGSLAEIYTPLKNIKDLAEGKRASLEDLPKEQLIKYAAIDSDATIRVYRVLAAKLREDPALLRYYLKFTKPVQDMLSDIYYNGTPVDIKQLAADEKELTELRDKLEDEALMLIPRAIREDPKHIKKQKLSRVALVRDYLFAHPKGLKLKPNQKYLTPKTKLPQISEKHIKQFAGAGVPFIDVYLRMCKASKVLGTYLKKYWGSIKPDGRVYPSIRMTTTSTGRTTMSEPVIQTVPQRSEFAKYAKRCFVAPEGWLMGARDLGTSEIRILGWLAGDPNILESLQKGIDIHTRTAAIVNGMQVEDVTKEQRQKAKCVNFGFAYGMSARGFQAYAKDSYDSEFTEEECNKVREAFFAYPGGYYRLPEYYRKQEREVSVTGQVRSPIGRVRHLPDAQGQDRMLRSAAFRQAINTPTQSFSSDLALIGFMLFWREIAKRGWAEFVKPTWMIHDADMFLAREDYFAKAMQLLKYCMEDGAKKYILENFEVEIGYPVTSDGKGGPSWDALAEWDDENLNFKVKKEAAPVLKPILKPALKPVLKPKKGRVVISEEVDLDEDFG